MDKRVSGVCCVIKSCKSSKRKIANLRLFRFPKNEILLKKWIQACNVADKLETQKLKVCQRHFNPEQIGKRLLKNAIPERYLDIPPQIKVKEIKNTAYKLEIIENSNLGLQNHSFTCMDSDSEKISKNDKNIKEYTKSERRCIIKSCPANYGNDPNLRFFSFPKPNTDRFKNWVEIWKLTPADFQVKTILICEKHFWKAELCGKHYTPKVETKFFFSEPRYKVIGLSDPNFKLQEDVTVEKPKKLHSKCIIKTCGIISKDLANMMIFPKDALNLFNVWSDIFKLDPSEIFNIDIDSIKENDILYICQKHSLSTSFSQGSNSVGLTKKSNEHKNEIDKQFPLEKKNNRLQLLQAMDIYKNIENKDERENFEFYNNLQKYYEKEVIKIKKESEIEKIKYLSMISLLKEENLKLKEEIGKFN